MLREHPFRRYAELIDDWDAFEAAIRRPLPPTLWANPARLGRDALARLLASEGVATEPLGWQPGALKAAPDFAPGRHWGLFAGLFQTQEEAAMLPVSLLAPQPGERVLDLCAAPGNKTAQIATAMGATGTVVANELKQGRLAALRQTIKRLGLLNVVMTARPAQEYPLRAGPFDRVLVDAPCSGEGTIRKNPGAALTDGEAREHLAGRQRRMLTRALQLVRPGGRVVYSTCTFAPEENECVVGATLEALGGDARLVPASVPGLRSCPGVTTWQGRTLDSSLAGSLRLWPHHNDTGGFYVAVLERVTGQGRDHPALQPLEPAGEQALDALAQWFELPATWRDGLQSARWGGRYLHLLSTDAQLPARPPAAYCGLPAVGIQVQPAKLTTTAALRFGDRARRQVLDVDARQAAAFLARQAFHYGGQGLEAGYVLIRYRGYTLGMGCLRPRVGGWRVASLFPKAWSALAGRPRPDD